MAQIVKTLNYTGFRQVVVWPANWSTTVTAHLWGAGGGGGGFDAGIPGGNGTGGGYARKTFTVNGLDVIEISVGGAGGAGISFTKGGGGAAGPSLVAGASYSGAYGGQAGFSGKRGSSGGGGGSGGATVLRVNNIVLAVAGGGGGGGGAGVTGYGDGTAPGPNLNDTSPTGQNGGNHPADGGGGGAGGGGFQGGNAGYWGGGSATEPWNFADAIGQGGMFGTSAGDVAENPSGIIPGNAGGFYYPGSVGRGGTAAVSGQNGYAVLELGPNKVYVRNNGVWNTVNTVWVNVNSAWQPVQQLWVKTNGVWQPTIHSSAPDFINNGGDFGIAPRGGPTLQPAPPSGGGDTGTAVNIW